jgi:hypothetical protein
MHTQELKSMLISPAQNCPYAENPYLVNFKKSPNESILPLRTRCCPISLYQ